VCVCVMNVRDDVFFFYIWAAVVVVGFCFFV
jgi:hypothetical protein